MEDSQGQFQGWRVAGDRVSSDVAPLRVAPTPLGGEITYEGPQVFASLLF